MTVETNKTALILGLGHPRQNLFLRSFRQANLSVHAAYTELKTSRWSRYLDNFIHLPANPDQQLETLLDFGKLHGGFLVPTNDEYIGLVSQNWDVLDRYFNIPLPAWDIVGPMIDREQSNAVASKIGIKVPKTWATENIEELDQIIAKLDFQNADYILKTRSVLSEPADVAGIRQTKPAPRNDKDFLLACQEIQGRTGSFPLIQQVIPGGADAAIGVTMVVNPAGEVILIYCVRRLRLKTYKLGSGYVHPYVLGSVVWCETINDDEAMEAARQLVKAFNYTGQVTIEFRRDSRDNSMYLMKIEPRPVRATSLSASLGMDIAKSLYSAFNGEKPQVKNDYEDGLGWLYVQPYLASLIKNEHGNRMDLLRLLRKVGKLRAFGEEFRDPVPLATGMIKLGTRGLLSKLR